MADPTRDKNFGPFPITTVLRKERVEKSDLESLNDLS